MKGVGRVAFIAHLETITTQLDAGWPIKAVYERHATALNMSYAQFARYVDQIIRRGRAPLPATASRPGLMSASLELPSQPPAPAQPPRIIPGGPTHAGHAPARTFNHDPLERPDDRKRLLGEG
jgi:hypothetical protein